ncbi:MAG: sugar transferase [Desulfobacterales bacterium]|nr:sugar transferase [Desulfobacterales bacterium]
MLRERSKLIVQVHKLLDICLTAAAFVGAYFIKRLVLPYPFRGLSIAPNYYIVLLTIVIIWYATFGLFDLYASYRRQTLGQVLAKMIQAVFAAMLVLMLYMYFFKIMDVSRIMIGTFFLLDIGLLALSKWLVYATLSHYRQKGFNFRNILIVGSREMARDVIAAIGDRLGAGYRVLGCLEVDQHEVGKKVENGIQVIGTIDSLQNILLEQVVDELIFAIPLREIDNAYGYIALAEEVGVSVRIVPDWQVRKLKRRTKIGTIRFEDFLGIPTMALVTTTLKDIELLIKSSIDYAAGAVGFALVLPLFLLISLSIKLTSKGPVFFKQERCGLNGRRFQLYKFRTMIKDAEALRDTLNAQNEMTGPVFKLTDDPRITLVGRILRKLSLDELPQIMNVLRGEMSLVGPRPPIPFEVEEYEPWQRRRLSMKPGITCIWQVSGRNEINFAEWMRMDLEYIDNWSLRLDLELLLKTIPAVFMATGK